MEMEQKPRISYHQKQSRNILINLQSIPHFTSPIGVGKEQTSPSTKSGTTAAESWLSSAGGRGQSNNNPFLKLALPEPDGGA